MKKEFVFYTITIGFFVAIMISCIHELPNASNMPVVCFKRDVLPIFQGSCASTTGCHNSTSAAAALVLTDFSSIMKSNSITAYDPKNSEAYQAIIAKWFNAMPPDRPLSETDRTLIRVWIEQGAVDIDCSVPVASPGTPIDPTTVDNSVCFSRDIQPILSSSCAVADCHDNISKQGDLDLSTYNLLMSYGLVKSGNATKSKFYKVLNASGEDRMPRAPKLPLSTSQINLIAKWINEGATNNACASNCDTTIFTYSGAIDKIITNNCKGCHSGPTPQKNVSLTNYNEVKAIVNDGRLLNVLQASNTFPQMPPSQKLSDCNITQIKKWIKANALNN